MTSTYFLLDDIRNRLKAEFSGMLFREPVENGNPSTLDGKEKYREPHFYVGQLPPKRSGVLPDGDSQGEDIPFVLVKLLTGKVTGEQPREYRVNVGIVFAVFVPEDDPEAGLQDLMNIGDRVIAILSTQRTWGANRFIQELPITLVQGSGKADNVYAAGLQIQGPYYMAAVTTQFMAAALPQIPPRNVIDAGEPEHPAYKVEDN